MPVVVGWASAGLADPGGGLLNGVPHHCLCGLLSCVPKAGWACPHVHAGFQMEGERTRPPTLDSKLLCNHVSTIGQSKSQSSPDLRAGK